MKHLLLSVALLASLAATGCAASSAADDDGGPIDEDAGFNKDAKTGTDSSSNKDTGDNNQCVPTCSTDEDCQNSCPEVPNGVNCCDTSTGICYAFASSTCPAPVSDAGFD